MLLRSYASLLVIEMEEASLEKVDSASDNCWNISSNSDSETTKMVGTFCVHNMTDELTITKAKLTHCLSFVKLHQWYASNSQLKKKCYVQVQCCCFCCLQLVLLDSKGIVAEHVLGFVATLEMFFSYGLMSSLCIFPVYKHGLYSNGFTSGSLDEYASSVRLFVA
jgi:hypothetical protein